jgi:hypothetical protein
MNNVLLSGIVGSTAYGLNTPESDIDRLGIFAEPTKNLLGLHPPSESHVTSKPDATFHEARKAALLMLSGNPTVMELLWLDSYEKRSPLGDELLSIRMAFLSAGRVRSAYLGYATSQFKKLKYRHENLQCVRSHEECCRIHPEQSLFRQSGENVPDLLGGEAEELLPEGSGEVPRGKAAATQPLCEREGLRSSGFTGKAPEENVRPIPEILRNAVEATGRQVSDLRQPSGSGGPRPSGGAYKGLALSQMQPGTGALLGRSGSTEEGGGLLGEGERPRRVRLEKHARHLVRLLQQGVELYTTGTLTLRLSDPDSVRSMGVGIAEDPSRGGELIAMTERFFDGKSALPESPNREAVEGWLQKVRAHHYLP